MNVVAKNVADPCQSVRELFSQSTYMPLKWISCESDAGRIVLSGEVPTHFLKQIAQSLASQVTGVQGIENRIRVVDPELSAIRGPHFGSRLRDAVTVG
ncbi:MAG: BON domain-containing protein [Planctomycetota bacterium]